MGTIQLDFQLASSLPCNQWEDLGRTLSFPSIEVTVHVPLTIKNGDGARGPFCKVGAWSLLAALETAVILVLITYSPGRQVLPRTQGLEAGGDCFSGCS